MSSGFVSGGTADQPIERDDEWKRAAQELEDARKAKEDLAKQHDGKSLFEVLQANKEKKQAEFEERARFKLHNALDDDEADYLEALLEKKRKEEANVKKETSEQLDLFRQQREEAERKALEEEASERPAEDNGTWAAVGRKRKKPAEGGALKGVKFRKSSTAPTNHKVSGNTVAHAEAKAAEAKHEATTQTLKGSTDDDSAKAIVKSATTITKSSTTPPSAKPPGALSLDLGYASSDDGD